MSIIWNLGFFACIAFSLTAAYFTLTVTGRHITASCLVVKAFSLLFLWFTLDPTAQQSTKWMGAAFYSMALSDFVIIALLEGHTYR